MERVKTLMHREAHFFVFVHIIGWAEISITSSTIMLSISIFVPYTIESQFGKLNSNASCCGRGSNLRLYMQPSGGSNSNMQRKRLWLIFILYQYIFRMRSLIEAPNQSSKISFPISKVKLS